MDRNRCTALRIIAGRVHPGGTHRHLRCPMAPPLLLPTLHYARRHRLITGGDGPAGAAAPRIPALRHRGQGPHHPSRPPRRHADHRARASAPPPARRARKRAQPDSLILLRTFRPAPSRAQRLRAVRRWWWRRRRLSRPVAAGAYRGSRGT